jgi:hypothetical protein
VLGTPISLNINAHKPAAAVAAPMAPKEEVAA